MLPFITAISVDVFRTVPPVLRRAAYGVGCTTGSRPQCRDPTKVGVIGGIMLALGRRRRDHDGDLHHRRSFRIQSSRLSPGTTISAAIASSSPSDDPSIRSDLGLLLFVLTFFVLAAARMMLMRLGGG